MHITAVIAEYNPFHAGHAYQIRQARRLGADYVICLMSPDFVQRGEPAITDCYFRAHMALLGGADAVFALPIHTATGSAEFFARGALTLLNDLNCVDTLCFGCEDPDTRLLELTAGILSAEPAKYREVLQRCLASGLSYPAAREAALYAMDPVRSQTDPDTFHRFIASPNHILALEYIKSIQKLGSAIRPLPIQRKGAGYHDTFEKAKAIPSASALRQCLLSPDDPAKQSYLSSLFANHDFYSPLRERHGTHNYHHVYEQYALHLQHTVWQKRDHLTDYLDVTEDLAAQICRHGFSGIYSAAQMADAVRSKNLTQARVRRALLHVCLDIRTKDVTPFYENRKCRYLQLLGFKKTAAPLMHRIRQESTIPIISKNAAAAKLLSKEALPLFESDQNAVCTYHFLSGKQDFHSGDYRRSPVIIE